MGEKKAIKIGDLLGSISGSPFPVLLFGFGLIFVIVSVAYLFLGYNQQHSQFEDRAKMTAERIAKALSHSTINAQEILFSIEKRLKEENLLAEPDSEKKKRIFKILSSFQVEWVGIGWTNAKGEFLLGSFSGILDAPYNISDREYVQAALASDGRDVLILQPFISTSMLR